MIHDAIILTMLCLSCGLSGFAIAHIRLRNEITALQSTIRFLENSRHLDGRYRENEGAIDILPANVFQLRSGK